MRPRHIAAIATLVLVAGVVTYQAITAEPPAPYVRLATDTRPLAPHYYYGCERGLVVIHYTTGEGERLDPVPTGRPCDGVALPAQTMPGQ